MCRIPAFSNSITFERIRWSRYRYDIIGPGSNDVAHFRANLPKQEGDKMAMFYPRAIDSRYKVISAATDGEGSRCFLLP
jgi:hypothetical protein